MSNQLRLTVVTDERVSNLSAHPTTTLSMLSQQIEIEVGIPPHQMQLIHNNRALSPMSTQTLSDVGMSSGDLIMVSRADAADSQEDPTSVMEAIRGNRMLMQGLQVQRPDLHARLISGDTSVIDQVRQYVESIMNNARRGQGQRGSARGGSGGGTEFADPMSMSAQREIEERIRQSNINENMEAAMEHNPESFGSVVMLFVDCKVNDTDGVKAFVDSGAQTTIISKECARRCNILRLLDSRFAGTARGVGTAKIHGRIHLALLTLGNEVFEVSFTVMDAVGGDYDMLLGLDMLKKHRASIDLGKDCLRIGNSEVPFLAEKDIPLRMRTGGRAASGDIPNTSSDNVQPSGEGRNSSSAGASASGGSSSEQGVAKLVELGFSRQEAIEALGKCNGNVDQAATMLAAQKYGF